MLLVDFLTYFSLLKGKLQCHLQLLPVKFGNICIGYQEKPLIAVNMVGIINGRCHFTEASQHKVEAAALGRDVGNLNQQENLVEAPNCSHYFCANQLGYLYQLL